MADPVVRLATHEDLDALMRLELNTFTSDRFTTDQIRYLVARAKSTVVLVEQSGQLIGAAYLLWRKDSRSGRLYSIAIDPSAQGRGLGELLLTECEQQTVAHGKDRLLLEVRVDNVAAIRFYLRHGYEEIGRLPGYYEDGTDGLKMAKRIVRP